MFLAICYLLGNATFDQPHFVSRVVVLHLVHVFAHQQDASSADVMQMDLIPGIGHVSDGKPTALIANQQYDFMWTETCLQANAPLAKGFFLAALRDGFVHQVIRLA